jgi:hypothetical protein
MNETSLDYNFSSFNSNIDFDSTNFTKEFLEELGLIQYQEKTITFFTRTLYILGVCLCIIGIVGNFLSILVLTRKSMSRLSTYHYLLGLAICDIISLSSASLILMQYSIPSSLRSNPTFNNNYKILLIYVLPIVGATQALSVWLTLAFTVDRYLYVCKPYKGLKHCTRRRSTIIISCLYLLAAVYSIPQFFERNYDIINIFGIKHLFTNLTAFGRNNYFFYIYHVFVYCTFVCFIPFTTIFVLNVFLIKDIIKSNKRRRNMSLMFINTNNLNGNHVTDNKINNINLNSSPRSSLGEWWWRHKPTKLLLFSCFRKNKATVQENAQNAQEQIELLNNATTNNNTTTNNNILSMTESKSLSINPYLLNGATHDNGAMNGVNRSHRESYASEGGAIGGSGGRKRSVSLFRHRKQSVNFSDKKIRNDVTIMLVGLIVLFFFCQSPTTILRLITIKNLSVTLNSVYYNLQDVSNFLIVTNSTLNCLLYIMLGKKFRKELVEIFCSKCAKAINKSKNSIPIIIN